MKSAVSRSFVFGVSFCAVLMGVFLSSVSGQSSRSRGKRTTNTKAIDVRAAKMERGFIRDAADIAKEYSDAGDLEKSKKLLEAILKLDDSLDVVRDKIKEIDEQIMTSNSADVEIDTSKGWTPVALVAKGKKFRIEAAGQYKTTLSMNLDVTGLTADMKSGGLAGGIPMGELIGMVLPANAGAAPQPPRGKKKRDDGPKPFRVGEGREISPPETGQLLLKVNMPVTAKCTGKIKIHLSGYVRTPKSGRSKSSR